MAKLTIDQKIAKAADAIIKEELAIEQSKEKIKNLKAELKKLRAEKDQSFTLEILKLMKANGISQETVLNQLKGVKIQETTADRTPEPELSSPDVIQNSSSIFDTYSAFGSKPENSLHYQNAEK